MAILYKANETDFTHFGLGMLQDAIQIFVTEERNGILELEMQYPVSGDRFADLKLDRLIKADAGHYLKNQRFKIIRITKPLNGIVTVYGEHVSMLTRDLPLPPNVSFSGDATSALNTWKNSIIGIDPNPFTVFSDISLPGSGSWSIKDVKNARDALGGVEGSLLDTYGGEYLFDNYDIKLYANRGKQSGALIAYGRNLTDLEQEENIADTYTSIYPYAVVSDDNQNEIILTLPEYYLDSEYVSNYARRKILTVDFSGDDVTTVEQLRTKAEAYIINNRIGVPKVNLKIKYVDLAKTLDYEETQALEEVNVCDWVTIYFEEYGIKTNEKIIKTVWDDLLKQYDSIEVGEARASLAQSINTTVDGKLETVAVNLNTIRLAADGKTKIYTGLAEPVASNINDLWYKPVDSGAVEMYRWNGIIWALQKTSADTLAGTVDFATVQAINIDANAITTGTLSGANFWLNLITGLMRFIDPVSQDTLDLDQAKIIYGAGTTYERILAYTSEGWKLYPGPNNTGTNLNTSLRLHGGITYVDFFGDLTGNAPESTHRARVESNGEYLYLRTANGEVVKVIDWGGNPRDIIARDFITSDPNNPTHHYADRWETPRDGNRSIVISPNGTGSLYICDPTMTAYYNIKASDFVVSSSETIKTNIVESTISALDQIMDLTVVEYDLIKDVQDGTVDKQLGFIAENSPAISNPTNDAISLYKANALATKGVQELLARIEALEAENATMKADISAIK
ncbi:chaperone of endosialidase [Trichococcus palustris]|uniref:Chaperone of endosialidase n=1 Tax=Trichococcus palustris TaxID=140314 RepID=A0A143YAK5_9LACT|nr:phage tail spike protein [Trichococcus palustris]CZQ83994.1 chaperone of endosialidase [Trichococcus palustris]SFK71073.1 phage minor structural protein, N-terminal region [Trichococcus palustris]